MGKRERVKFSNRCKNFGKTKIRNMIASRSDWRHFAKLRSTYCEGLLTRENTNTQNSYFFGMASRFSSMIQTYKIFL